MARVYTSSDLKMFLLLFFFSSASCYPADDCRRDVTCHEYAECKPDYVVRRYQCQCVPGYEGDGVVACRPTHQATPPPQRLSDCRTGGVCHELARCVPTHGRDGYECRCAEGYAGDGVQVCQPRHRERVRCSTGDTCHPHAECRPVSQGDPLTKCTCKEGFVGDGRSRCDQVEPSEVMPPRTVRVCTSHRECHSDGECMPDYELRKFVCQCKHGYDGDGRDRCEAKPCQQTCSRHATCVYDICTCDEGYRGDGHTCSPMEGEDRRGCTTQCHQHATCRPNYDLGRFQCTCQPGYDGDGVHRCDLAI